MDEKTGSELIPLHRALREAEDAGLPCSLDKWERLVRWGMMRSPEPIPETNRLGITKARAARLRYILDLEAHLPGRTSGPKLAFHAAASGLEVLRPSLVANHIEAGLKAYYAFLHRHVRRFGKGVDIRNLRPGDTKKLAQYAARPILKQLRANLLQRLLFSQLLVSVLTLLFDLILGRLPARSARARLRPIVGLLVTDQHVAEEITTDLSEFLVDNLTIFRDPVTGQNRLLETVHHLAADDVPAILRGARDAGLFMARMRKLFLSERAAHIPTPSPKPSQEREWLRLLLSFIPFLAALFVQMQVEGRAEKTLQMLRSDKVTPFEEVVGAAIDLSKRYYPESGA